MIFTYLRKKKGANTANFRPQNIWEPMATNVFRRRPHIQTHTYIIYKYILYSMLFRHRTRTTPIAIYNIEGMFAWTRGMHETKLSFSGTWTIRYNDFSGVWWIPRVVATGCVLVPLCITQKPNKRKEIERRKSCIFSRVSCFSG